MMLDVNSKRPDWAGLCARHPGNVLLHVNCPFIEVVSRVRGRLAYLATPYSREVLNDDLRFDRALSIGVEVRTARWARVFALNGATAVSPILQACAICQVDAERAVDPLDDLFWSYWCQPLLAASGSVVIPAMSGWDRSMGVWREALWALRHNVPVYLVAPGSDLFEGRV